MSDAVITREERTKKLKLQIVIDPNCAKTVTPSNRITLSTSHNMASNFGCDVKVDWCDQNRDSERKARNKKSKPKLRDCEIVSTEPPSKKRTLSKSHNMASNLGCDVKVDWRDQNRDSERKARKKKSKPKLRDCERVSTEPPSSYTFHKESPYEIESTVGEVDNGMYTNCEDQGNQHGKKKNFKLKSKSKSNEVSAESVTADKLLLGSPEMTSTSGETIVGNFSEFNDQLNTPVKKKRKKSSKRAIDETIKLESHASLLNELPPMREEDSKTQLEDTTMKNENSFTEVLECKTMLGNVSDKFLNGENENDSKKRFECDVCHRTYTRRDNLLVHKRTHTSNLPFKCNECDRSFNYKHVLTEHVRIVHSLTTRKGQEVTLFGCPQCSYEAKREQDLQRHINAIHENCSGQIYPCKLCSSIFTHPSNLKKHNDIVHLKKMNNVCHICGKFFCQSANLKKHVENIHCKTQIHCPVCEQEFQNLHRLTMHLGTHVPRVGFNCPFCEYVLVSESDERLKRHIREQHKARK